MHLLAVGLDGGGQPVGQRVAVERGAGAARVHGGGVGPGGGTGQGAARLRPHGDRAGDRGDGEPGVGEAEAQGVDVSHEPGVDDGDAPVGGDGGEERLRLTHVGGGPHLEAEGPEIVRQGGSGHRLAGDDGGRQPYSLPGGAALLGAGDIRGGSPRTVAGGVSAEAIGSPDVRDHRPSRGLRPADRFRRSEDTTTVFSTTLPPASGRSRPRAAALTGGGFHGVGHQHGHGHGAGSGATVTAAHRGRLRAALVTTLLVTAAGSTGGVPAGSPALVADAAHMATDALGLGMALLALRLPAGAGGARGARGGPVPSGSVRRSGPSLRRFPGDPPEPLPPTA
ncbi:hypothetical protein M2169_000312 [Streptomyces sp. MJP52]|nr:hypothetical protein [Streptomyces sp. MJP52]